MSPQFELDVGPSLSIFPLHGKRQVLLLKIRFADQEPWHHRKAHQKCRITSTSSDPLNQNLHLNKIPIADESAH